MAEGYQQFGYTIPPTDSRHEDDGVGDSRAMTVCSGPELMVGLGLTEADLFPVAATLSGAANDNMDIMGGVFCEIIVYNREKDRRYKSNQMVYIIHTCKNVYLSYSSLLDFEVCDTDFPMPGRASEETNNASVKQQPPIVEKQSHLEKVTEEDLLGEESPPGQCVTVNGK